MCLLLNRLGLCFVIALLACIFHSVRALKPPPRLSALWGGGPMNILPASKAAKQFALPAVFLFRIIIAPLAVRAVSVAVDSRDAHRAAPKHPVLARNQQLAF